MKKKLPKLSIRRKKSKKTTDASQVEHGAVPRITNETVAAHRDEVLSSARKYIYPLQHSKHKVVLITTGLVIAATVGFFTYCIVALYRVRSTSSFLYGVTQVIPFPVAKAGSRFVAYENYLFELRHYMHYYQTQQKVDFNSGSGKEQLNDFRKRTLDKVINDTYVKELAKKHKVSVSGKEVDDEIRLMRTQQRLGGSDKVFEDVLKTYYGWSVNDLKRVLRQQLLGQKVAAALDAQAKDRAAIALNELKNGADFAATAKKYSDDASTKENGGEFGVVDRTSREIDAKTTQALFTLKPGQTSEIINTGYGLAIVKMIEKQGEKARGARIVFNFKDINGYINDLKDRDKIRVLISK